MGWKLLRKDVAAVQEKARGAARFELEDGTVRACFDALPAPIDIVFCQPDEYANSPVLVMCAAAHISAQLEEVCDSFEDGGALQSVLELICHTLKLGACRALQSVPWPRRCQGCRHGAALDSTRALAQMRGGSATLMRRPARACR